MSRIPLPLAEDLSMPAAPARNIDIMSHRPCDQECRQCAYVESEMDPAHPRGSTAEIELIRRVRANYSDSTMFLYTRDIVTATALLPVMQEIGQTETLTNGNRLDADLIEQLKGCGLQEIQITLFGTPEEQASYNRNTREEQEVCLGGCRSAAVAFAKDDSGEDRLYAGMDLCLTPAYARYHARQGIIQSGTQVPSA